jgi:hypothetical protein
VPSFAAYFENQSLTFTPDVSCGPAKMTNFFDSTKFKIKEERRNKNDILNIRACTNIIISFGVVIVLSLFSNRYKIFGTSLKLFH